MSWFIRGAWRRINVGMRRCCCWWIRASPVLAIRTGWRANAWRCMHEPSRRYINVVCWRVWTRRLSGASEAATAPACRHRARGNSRLDETPQRLHDPGSMAIHHRRCAHQTSQLGSGNIKLKEHLERCDEPATVDPPTLRRHGRRWRSAGGHLRRPQIPTGRARLPVAQCGADAARLARSAPRPDRVHGAHRRTAAGCASRHLLPQRPGGARTLRGAVPAPVRRRRHGAGVSLQRTGRRPPSARARHAEACARDRSRAEALLRIRHPHPGRGAGAKAR